MKKILLAFIIFIILFSPIVSHAQIYSYGGYLLAPFPCLNGVGQVLIQFKGFVPVPLIYVFEIGSRLNLFFNIFTPLSKQVGTLYPGGVCVVPTPIGPIPVPVEATVTTFPHSGVGTSLF